MATTSGPQAYVLDMVARRNPLERRAVGLSGVTGWGTSERLGGVAVSDHVWRMGDAAPVWCALPCRPDQMQLPKARRIDPPIVWGFARQAVGTYEESVLLAGVDITIDPPVDGGQPSTPEAIERAGTVWASAPDGRGDYVDGLRAGCAELAERVVPSAVDPNRPALDLHRLASRQAHAAVAEIERRFLEEDEESVKVAARAGRLVFVDDPAAVLPDEAIVKRVTIGLGAAEHQIDLGIRWLALSDSRPQSFLSVFARPTREALGEQADACIEVLRRSFELLVAHTWLLARADAIVARLSRTIDTILDRDQGADVRFDARTAAYVLRKTFLERIELVWSLESSAPVGGEDVVRELGRLSRVTPRWERELARYQGLVAIIDGTQDPGPRQPDPFTPAMERIPGFKEEENPFVQLGLALANRAHSRTEARDRGLRAWLRRAALNGWERWYKGRHERRGQSASQSRMRRRDATPDGRLIHIHPFRNRPALFEELNASIALTTFMTATAFVFLGLILQDPDSFVNADIDVAFLFVSAFGFFFATLIYANASGQLARHGTVSLEERVETANRVSEYFGVYPLLIAVPLAVSRYLGDNGVTMITMALAVVMLGAYHYTHDASLLERDVSDEAIATDWWRTHVFIPILLLSMAVAFAGALLDIVAVIVVAGIAFGWMMIAALVFSALAPERPDPRVYEVHDWDMLGEDTPDYYGWGADSRMK